MKPSIPDIPYDVPTPQRQFMSSVKENIEVITGKRRGRIETLSTTATLAQVIAAYNALVARLQD